MHISIEEHLEKCAFFAYRLFFLPDRCTKVANHVDNPLEGIWSTYTLEVAAGKSEKVPCPRVNFPKMITVPEPGFQNQYLVLEILQRTLCAAQEIR